MKELVVWLIHFPAGIAAALAAIAAFRYPKGSPGHRKAGRVFVIAMFIMLISGGIAGALKGVAEDVFLAALVFYSVFTAWLSVRAQPSGVGVLEYIALAYIVVFGIAALSINPEWEMVREPGVFTFDAILALAFAIGDVRNILLNGLTPRQRLARHVWRISFSLVWAALAFSDKVIKMLDSTIDQMPFIAFTPAALVLGVMFYWLYRIRRRLPDGRLLKTEALHLSGVSGP